MKNRQFSMLSPVVPIKMVVNFSVSASVVKKVESFVKLVVVFELVNYVA